MSILETAARSLVSVVVLFAVFGCATSGSTAPSYEQTTLSITIVDERTARKEVDDAARLINNGEYPAVVPHLRKIVSRYPKTKAGVEARYLLGLVLFRLEDFRDAEVPLLDYLKLDPDGKYASQSQELLARLRDSGKEGVPSLEELEREIRALRANAASSPPSQEILSRLAQALWQQGNYEEAGKVYTDLAAHFPDAAKGASFRARMEAQPGGGYIVLSPVELDLRRIAAHPLSVINTNNFKSGRDRRSGVPRYYVVSGQVLNRGNETLYEVNVFATIFAFGNVIYDTANAALGSLRPGQMRAFSFRFSNFEDINSIDRYTVEGSYR